MTSSVITDDIWIRIGYFQALYSIIFIRIIKSQYTWITIHIKKTNQFSLKQSLQGGKASDTKLYHRARWLYLLFCSDDSWGTKNVALCLNERSQPEVLLLRLSVVINLWLMTSIKYEHKQKYLPKTVLNSSGSRGY